MRKEDKLPSSENFNSEKNKNQYNLILYNDDVHDFSYVIESLVEVCNHDSVQAEQCTYLAHYNGRCEVKTGRLNALKRMKDALIERGLQAEVQ